jgi:monooxygenase
LIKYMDVKGLKVAIPHDATVTAEDESLMNLSSGYVQRAKGVLPRQGNREPWRAHHNYFIDRWNLKRGPLDNGMEFRSGPIAATAANDAPVYAEAAE